MKITFRQLLDSVNSFKELQDIKFSPKVALTIYKTGKSLDKELQTYKDLATKIYEDHEVPKTETGFDFGKLEKDKYSELTKDLDELLSSEIDIEDRNLYVEDLERFNIEISPRNLVNLDWFIKEKEVEAENVD